jgi:hypothetical protein
VAVSLGTRHFRYAEFLAERADATYEKALLSNPMNPTAAAREAMATIRTRPMAPQPTAEQQADLRYAIGTAMEQLWSAGLSFPAPVEGGVETPAPVKTAPAVSMPVSRPPSTAHPARRNASTFVEAFFAQRETEKDARHQVMGQDRKTLMMFLELRGDRPFAEYERMDITGFLDEIRRLPKLHGKSPHFRGAVRDIIAEADRRRERQRLSARTVQRHFSALQQFFKFAVNQGAITPTRRFDLFGDIEFQMERGARFQREAWPVALLIVLFTSPIYTGCQQDRRWAKGPHIIRDARFWIPLLALFHGARVEEFCDLYRRDIGCEDGTWFMHIRGWVDKTEGTRRTLKTEAAWRRMPIHPEIIRMGFLDYIAATAPMADQTIFPDLSREGVDGKRSPSFVRWFGGYRQRIGVYREGVASQSFRHNVITRLKAVARDPVMVRHVNYMVGHEQPGTEGDKRYDKGPAPSESVATLALLRYPELDFSRLYVAG